MKKYLFILLASIFLGSCSEDTSVDTTVMPPATTTGANTFGCLVDGWAYVGGRYNNWDDHSEWTTKSFRYYESDKKLTGRISVTPSIDISFTILSPQEGRESAVTNLSFGNDNLEDGVALISRFDTKSKIISGTFESNDRLTNGRFDIHYSKVSESPSPDN